MSRSKLRYTRIYLCLPSIVTFWAQHSPSQTVPPATRTVIRASAMLDGKAGVLHKVRIVVEKSRIVAIDHNAGPVDYDLGGLTVLPGWIDGHVHLASSFGKDGKNGGPAGTEPEVAYQEASNAWAALMAGFTTVQSLGSSSDIPLRDAIARGSLPGPRILTSAEPLTGQGEKIGTPDAFTGSAKRGMRRGKETGLALSCTCLQRCRESSNFSRMHRN